jgi:hypothetical protein
MKTLPKFLPVIVLVISSSIFFIACQKQIGNDSNSVPAGNTKYSVFLTDGPNDYQQVMIDIQKIEIKLDTCKTNRDEDHDKPGCDNDHDSMDHHCEIWQELDIHPGKYDLLKLRNGIDTLLASGVAGAGKIERIKITLGTDNSVMVDSVQHPLLLINNQNFVFINIHKEHLDSATANDLQLFLDFDLLHSIRYFNGQYWLKPVLKPFGKHHTGEIEGKVRPVNSFGLIKAFNETDTAYARPGDEGEFKIRGLKDGTYNVLIDGLNGYQDSTISNVIVHRRQEVDLGNIELHQ